MRNIHTRCGMTFTGIKYCVKGKRI